MRLFIAKKPSMADESAKCLPGSMVRKDIRIYALHEIINDKDKIIMSMSNRNTVPMKILNKGDNKFFVIE
ncbi:hypothetical protein [Pelosinus sp. sgz500959]|uniref:hypothetical protein n=1 Tax=Pelosinus sp. sgz500959 TaxID=3242472 RepID=UPI00366B2E30